MQAHQDRSAGPERHRALFLSDLHLGTLGSRADLVLDFLQAHSAEVIYLVGDIFDVWEPLVLRWSAAETAIVALLRQRAAEGVRLVYLSGNHDAPYATPRCRSALGDQIGLPVTPERAVTHHAADGRRFLVLHGDVCDARALRFHVLTRLGSRIDSLLVMTDAALRRLRIVFGPQGRGPMKLLLSAVNDLLYRSRSHERRLVALARAQGLDGVICGHFHIAALHDDHGPLYANCGDWVDNFTALAESPDGTLRLLTLPPAAEGAARPGPLHPVGGIA